MVKDIHGLPINNSSTTNMERFGSTLETYYKSLGCEVHSSGGGYWGINFKVEQSELEVFAINDADETLLPEPDGWIHAETYYDGERLDRSGRFSSLAELFDATRLWLAEFNAKQLRSADTGNVVGATSSRTPRM